jgi:hypothetical protein
MAAPLQVLAGTPFDVTVNALDAYGHAAIGYRGTVRFAATDSTPGVAFPLPYTFTAMDQGAHTFVGGFALMTVGEQVLTATDAANRTITGGVTVTVVSVPSAPPRGSSGRPPTNPDDDITPVRFTLSGERIIALDRLFGSLTNQELAVAMGRRGPEAGEVLSDLLGTAPDAQLAVRFGRSVSAVRVMRWRIGR